MFWVIRNLRWGWGTWCLRTWTGVCFSSYLSMDKNSGIRDGFSVLAHPFLGMGPCWPLTPLCSPQQQKAESPRGRRRGRLQTCYLMVPLGTSNCKQLVCRLSFPVCFQTSRGSVGPNVVLFVGRVCDLVPGLNGKWKTSKGVSKSRKASFYRANTERISKRFIFFSGFYWAKLFQLERRSLAEGLTKYC